MAVSSVVLSPVTGQRVVVAPQWTAVRINPATNLGRLLLVLPPHQFENASFVLSTTQDINNLDVDIGTAKRLQGCPIQLRAGDVLTFVYTGLTLTWSVTIGGTLPADNASSTYYILGTNPLIIQVDPSGYVQDGDLAFMLRQGALVGLNLKQLRPPGAALLGGAGNGSFNSISLDPTLTLASGVLAANVGTTAGTVAAGDAFAAAQITANAALPRTGGIMTGDIFLAGDPTDPRHPTTREYVDTADFGIAATAGSALLAANSAVAAVTAAMPRTGGSFSGPVLLAGPPAAALGAVTKAYADAADLANATAAGNALAAASRAQSTASSALSQASNLADLSSVAQARLNLGLGPAALLSIGAGHNTLCAGDDPRILGALQYTLFGTPNGVATLDQFGRLNLSQIPLSVLGALVYQGTWDAANNIPLLQSGIGTKGNIFVVAGAGSVSLDGVNQWNVGDWAVFDGNRWDKVNGIAAEVLSVVGYTGAITLGQLVAAGVAPLTSPSLLGVPTAPTAAAGTSTNQIATTAFVLGQGFLKAAGTALTNATIDSSVIGGTAPAAARVTTLTATGTVVFSGTDALTLPTGTTSQRPVTGVGGMVRYNASINRFESYSGTSWYSHVRLTGDTMTGTLTVPTLIASGGSIDGVAVGSATPAPATVTTLAVTGSLGASYVLAAPTAGSGAPTWRRLSASDVSGLSSLATQAASAVSITGGSIDGASVGANSPAPGSFTTLMASQLVSLGSSSSLVVGPATGGNKGAGTINATAIYVNGQAVGIAGGYVLPPSTPTTIGGVIVPTSGNLAVDGSGNLSVVWSSPGALGATAPNSGSFTSLSASGSVVFSGTGAVVLPTGTAGQQPAGAGGMARLNSTTTRFEFHNGAAWVNYVRLNGDTMTGTLTLSSLVATGGTVDGVAIGGSVPSSGSFTTLGASATVTLSGTASLLVGAPAGGNKGAGTINAAAIYINGQAVSAGAAIVPATSSVLGGVIVAAASGLLVDNTGSLSVNWASPGALGGTAPAAAVFTSLYVGQTGQNSSNIVLNAAAGSARNLVFQSGSQTRWVWAADGSAENGSNAGSSLGLYAFSDASAYLSTPISISRATGLVTLAQGVAVTGGTVDGVAIGNTLASTGRFTTLSLTSSQSQYAVLAAPNASGGAPSFRRLLSSDISGLGSLATQNSAAVSITGGTLSGVSLSSLSAIDFGSSVGNKISLYSNLYGIGLNSYELCFYTDSGQATSLAYRQGGLSGPAYFMATATGINGTAIGATTPSTGSFTNLTVSGTASIPGYATTQFARPVSATLMLSGSVNPGTYTLNGSLGFNMTITSVTCNGGSVSGSSITFALLNNGNPVGGVNGATASGGSNATSNATSAGAVSQGSSIQIQITGINGGPSDAWFTVNGYRT